MDTTVLIVLILYLLVMLGIGYYFSRQNLNEDEFLLGGKKLPGWALAFSERATAESVWLLLGATGYVYTTGLSTIWLMIGTLIGIFITWLYIASRVMDETNKYGALTLPSLFSSKFPEHARLIRWFAGVVIAIFFTFYLAAQFSGAGKALHTAFGLNVNTGIIISAVVVILYSTMGGFMSVVWTDVVQSVLMLITLVVLPIVAYIKIQAAGISIPDSFAVAATPTFGAWTQGLTGFALAMMIVSEGSWLFGFLGGQPQLASRYMALKDTKDAHKGRNVALVWALLAYGGVFAIGILANALYGPKVVPDSEMILPFMINDLMPSWLAGLLLAGVIAAMMSTADSQLLALASSVTEDIIHKSLGIKLTEQQMVTLARLTVFIAGAAGLIIAYTSKSLIFTIVSYAWSGIGCTFSAALILALFYKKCSSMGIVVTLMSGLVVTIIWMNTPLEGIITSRAATFVIALALGALFSLIKPDKVKTEQL
ncbi:sodium/proline symporter [Sphaerochaeta sp.]|uniref:sodium/proline symporter n=1 Tax=Sphaerochaeta sp. TaxID=1972642 RepID=UPI003D11F435